MTNQKNTFNTGEISVSPEAEIVAPLPALPMMTNLQEMARYVTQQVVELEAQTKEMQAQGQMILQDLWRQHKSLVRDLDQMELERKYHLEVLNGMFDQRKEIASKQLEAVQAQINYYNFDPATNPPAQNEQLQNDYYFAEFEEKPKAKNQKSLWNMLRSSGLVRG